MKRTIFIAFWSSDGLIEVSYYTLRELRFTARIKKNFNMPACKNFFIHPNRHNSDGQWYSSCEEAVAEFRQLTSKVESVNSLIYFFFVIDRDTLPHFISLLSGGEELFQLAKPRISFLYETEIYLNTNPPRKNELMLKLALYQDENNYSELDLYFAKSAVGTFSLS